VAIESVLENGVGEVPDILVDSELCETYGWTWTECQAQPHYVRVMFWQIQQMKRAAQAQAQARQAKESDGRQVISYA
jgi:hypothetical protein